jgi:predicted transcriptional regulator
MGTTKMSARCAALMSIYPEFASRILAGEKLVEFRRRPPARAITHIVIYATSPVKAVVGVAEVERLERGSPQRLWRDFGDVGGIRREDFFRYFSGTSEGFAYVVGKTWSCASPIPLGQDGLPATAPQTFRYVDARTLDAVLNSVVRLTSTSSR